MKKTIKRLLKKPYICISKTFLSLFYEKKYLQGRYFENNVVGWKFAWRDFFLQKVIGYNRNIPWPMTHRSIVNSAKDLIFDVNDITNFQHFGCYYQNGYGAKIVIGKGTWIAPNVGIITANHDVKNLDDHVIAKNVILGENCWIGMNSVILPGVVLGENTVVGAGSVVTKSFVEGHCVVAGNPARILKKID